MPILVQDKENEIICPKNKPQLGKYCGFLIANFVFK